MRLYRIKHKPTGLFYCPVRGFGSRKTNLSKNGKVYTKKPTFAHMTHGFNFSDKQKKEFKLRQKYNRNYNLFNQDDWCIEMVSH